VIGSAAPCAPRPGGRAGLTGPALRPPAWLILATAALTLACLMMAVAETTLWTHYLIDQGEYLSLAGLIFILVAGIYLYRRGRLLVSLPLVLPWLLYPVITQGDQLIDNLTINEMRVVCQILLALLFGAPVAVVVLAARYALATEVPRTLPRAHWTHFLPGVRAIAEGRVRRGSGLLAATLFVAEIWVAWRYLGTLMIVTLVVMAVCALVYARSTGEAMRGAARTRGEGWALAAVVAGVVVSLGLYVGFKNRTGAYQGSPAYYMDPSQADADYPLQRIAVPNGALEIPSPQVGGLVRSALVDYARSLQDLVEGYYIADRNYNYSFHNALFLRNTPVLPDFRRVALTKIAQASRLAATADAQETDIEPVLPETDPLRGFVSEVKTYVAFTFRRAAILEQKTAEFERTTAGLQHATHIYEGEGKIVGVRLLDIIGKHRAVTAAPALAPITRDFMTISRAVHDKYSKRIVGF
jgi:hypothetical protein